MSRVFSFRLDENNPREARALAVIQERVSEGYLLRSIIVEALLRMKASQYQQEEVSEKLDKILGLVGENQVGIGTAADRKVSNELSGQLLNAIKNAVKPGKNIGSKRPVA